MFKGRKCRGKCDIKQRDTLETIFPRIKSRCWWANSDIFNFRLGGKASLGEIRTDLLPLFHLGLDESVWANCGVPMCFSSPYYSQGWFVFPLRFSLLNLCLDLSQQLKGFSRHPNNGNKNISQNYQVAFQTTESIFTTSGHDSVFKSLTESGPQNCL